MEMTAQELEDCKDLFQEQMKRLADEFEQELSQKFTRQTVQDYSIIVYAFLEYLYGYTNIYRFEDIKISDANSRFFSTCKYDALYDYDSKVVKSKMKAFFEFLERQGYEHPKVLNALKKR